MTLLVLQKARGMLVPADEDSERFVAAIRNGDGVELKGKVRRNVRFHRKLFALLRLVFDSWEPPRVVDERFSPVKSFEAFRKDILILAGHCDATYSPDGAVKLEARSISFDEVGEEDFSDIYSRVLDVVWTRVMRYLNYRSPVELEQTVARIVSFG